MHDLPREPGGTPAPLPFSDPAAAPYTVAADWVCLDTEAGGRPADVFFLCPTVSLSARTQRTERFTAETVELFRSAARMEQGIYDHAGRFFAPYYHQLGLSVFGLSAAEREPLLQEVYGELRLAFLEYLRRYDCGRPLILAGFSQGAELSLRLLRDFFTDPALRERLIACYALGWHITEDELAALPIPFASGEADTGGLILFDCEAPELEESFLLPRDARTLCINPLNWRTDSTPADRSLNRGGLLFDYLGNPVRELPVCTGAWIDPKRGALKLPDIDPADYPTPTRLFPAGMYHIYDYQFFYRNLQENVRVRVAAWLAKHASDPECQSFRRRNQMI